MYLRPIHAETSILALREFVQENPLGILTTAISSPIYDFIQSSHIPFVLDVQDAESDCELPILRGHLARQNPQAKAIIEHAKTNPSSQPRPDSSAHQLEQEVMILFNGPVHHYVTPKFYVKTKPESGKVQCYGVATIYFDANAAETSDFLSKQIDDLSLLSETKIMGHEKPWRVSDAPDRYIELLKKNIIGIEVKVTKMGGKFKMSQEEGIEDRKGVEEGYAAMGTQVGDYMAKTVKERGILADAAKAAKSVNST